MKDVLKTHLPFVEQMLKKVENTEFEFKWRKLHEVIMSDEEMDEDQIIKMDATLKALKIKLSCHPMQFKPATHAKPQPRTEWNARLREAANIEPARGETARKSTSKPPRVSLAPAAADISGSSNSEIHYTPLTISTRIQTRVKEQLTSPLNTKLGVSVNKRRRDELKEKKNFMKIAKNSHLVDAGEKQFLKLAKQFGIKRCTVPLVRHSMYDLENADTIPLRDIKQEIIDDFAIEYPEIVPITSIKIKPMDVEIKSEPMDEDLGPSSNIETQFIATQYIEEISAEYGEHSNDIKLEPFEIEVRSGLAPKEPAVVRKMGKTVSHMTYYLLGERLTMACKLCSYECQTKYDFQTHFALKHKNRWFGSCQSCVANVLNGGTGTLIDELEHMIVIHIMREPTIISNIPPKGPVFLSQYSHTNSPMVSIPSSLIKSSFPKPEKIRHSLMLNAGTTLKRLRPWLHNTKSTHQKFNDVCESMLTLECLSALYKCMSVGCSFFTCDVTLFRKHLGLHLRYQASDFNNFTLCPYCPFSGETLFDLVDHITSQHGGDVYQCMYCFYRSYDLQIGTHQHLYHTVRKASVIKCHVAKTKIIAEEMASVWSNVRMNVPGMSCMICKQKYYNFEQFIRHLKTHDSFPSTKCIKCSQGINLSTIVDHLRNCHGFGDFQCCFCRFGTDSLDTFMIHIANKHPSNMTLFFDRANSPASSSINANQLLHADDKTLPQLLTLKQLTLHLSNRCVVLNSPAPLIIRNEKNLHKLSKNYLINLSDAAAKAAKPSK